LREAGVKTGIVTSEDTQIVARRAKKMKVDFLIQNAGKYGGKLIVVQKICDELKIKLENVAYIGDDINCKELLENVGLAACPANAVLEIRQIPNIIQLPIIGGAGAFRQFANIILEKKYA
jgi:YrbI family 3-deoxy-D-manno-octulosonate 8-phosphate phosphatase